MELRIEQWPPKKVKRFGEVAEALVHLTDEGDGYLVLDAPGAFLQIGRWKGTYIVEWRQEGDEQGNRPLARAGRRGSWGKIVARGKFGLFRTYDSEQLRLGEAFEILCAFYHGPVRPAKFRWRGLSADLKRYSALKEAGKVK